MPDKPGRIRWMAADFRTWPRRAQIAVLAVLAAELAAPVVIMLVRPDLPHTDPADRPNGDIAVPADLAFPTAPEDEQPQDDHQDLPTYEGDPQQTFTVQSHFYSDLLETDHGLLVAGTSSAALESDGEVVWELAPMTDLDSVALLEQAVVVTKDVDDPAWSGREETTAHSPRTGEKLWADDEVDYTTAFDNGLFLIRCGPDEDDDTCTITARDSADGSHLWSTDAPAGAQFDLPENGFRPTTLDYLVLISEVPNEAFALSLVNRWTGEITGPTITESKDELEMAVYDGRVLSWTEYDDDPTDGCTSAIAGYAIGATEPTWETTAETRISADLSDCRNQPMRTPHNGHLAVTLNGHPALIDTATGATTWTGDAEAFAIGADDEVMATVQGESLVGMDMGTGEERWRTDWRPDSGIETRTVGITLWVRNCGTFDLCAVNLDTGEIVQLPGSFDYLTEDAVVTSKGVEDTTAQEVHFWPLDLWK